ncbi:MAG TPA: SLC13 family permease [Steroidobacteraceae bacterium]|nr:SLC13 family permease [Steroidobacteraceae bacterium]
MPSSWLTWAIVAASITGVLTRPKGTSEALWASIGAVALVVFSLLPPAEALTAVLSGTDVYLFLIGMMLLAELAREEGLFDWLAAYAVRHAAGSAGRLFLLIYGVGTLVTIFLSNDATAVVLTPAVYAVAKRANAAPCPTCSPAPSSPTLRASCCRSRIRQTWWCSATACRRCRRGSVNSAQVQWCPFY